MGVDHDALLRDVEVVAPGPVLVLLWSGGVDPVLCEDPVFLMPGPLCELLWVVVEIGV